jgi:hypothetical protein
MWRQRATWGRLAMPEARLQSSVRAWAGQALLYAAFALAVGSFSHWPVYHPIGADQALVKVSFVHAGKPVGDCRTLSESERADLPRNMRVSVVCPRERSPVTVEVDIDGRAALRRTAPPSGLSHDGASAVYERLVVRAGEQRIAVRLQDDQRAAGFTYQRQTTVRLDPFDAEKGGITFQ